MAKSILYRLFGMGKIPKDHRAALESEGLVLVEEGVRGTVIFRNFKAPGRRYSLRKTWFSGSVVLTKTRIIAFAFSKRIINVPFGDPLLKKLSCEARADDCLRFSFDAEDFNSDMSGNIEISFVTTQARMFADRLQTECP